MQLLKKIPFFLLLLVLFFCLHGSVENYGYISVREVLGIGISILAGIALLFALIFFLYRQWLAAALIVFFMGLWYLFFGALHDVIKSTAWLSVIKSYSVLLPVLLIVSVVWAIVVIKKKSWWPRLTLYLNILLLLYCSIDIVTLIYRAMNAPEKFSPPSIAINSNNVKTRPNIYYLVLDEYAGYASLRDSFGFRNDSFYNFLQEKGFEQLPVNANYKHTAFCMSSIFNMQYVNWADNDKGITQYDYLERMEEINNAAVFSVFKTMGYRIYNFSIFDVNDMPAINAEYDNQMVPRHRMLITDKILHNRVDREIGWAVPAGIKKWLPFLKNRTYLSDIKNIDESIQQTRQLARSVAKQPFFCYSHVLMPHWQYYFDSAGKANPLSVITPRASMSDKKSYLGYLHYTNRIMSSLISDIIAADPGAIVVLMSDHGYRQYFDERRYQPFQFDNICAVRMPGTDSLSYIKSNVNLFPYLLNRGFGQQLPYLKDTTIALVNKNSMN